MKQRFVILVALIAIAPPTSAWSQPAITLEGLVRDEAGGIARAEVSAVDSLTNERRNALTNDRGFFRMLGMSPGRYAVSARIIGYAAGVTQIVHLVAGQRAQLNFILEQATSTLETVQVHVQRTDAAEIERMSVSTALSAEEIERLPLNTRNVMDLAAVAPGIRSFQPIEGHSIPGAGALRDERALNFYLDGVEMKNFNSSNVMGTPQVGSILPIDGLQEFRVLLNPYDAEYTRGAGYIMSAVSHRGTNETHGSAFGFFQNKDLVSVNDFQRGIPNFEKPDFNRRQGGFSLRGPIVRNRLFYAASYEISDAANYVAVVPGQPASDPGYWDRYAGVFNAPSRNQAGLVRLTYAANVANVFEAIVSSRYFTGESRFGGTVSRESATASAYAVNTVNLRHRWLPASGLANELSLQFVRWSNANRRLVAGPELRYPTLIIGRANEFGAVNEKQFRVIDRVTYGVGSGPGSHLLKAGFEVSRVNLDQFTPNNGPGSFRFRTESGAPFEASIGVGYFDPHSDRDAFAELWGWVAGVYFNDEWAVTSRLVLNLGVRYDADINTMNNDFTVPWASDTAINSRPELRGLLNRSDRKDDLNNFSPRVSFSWDVTGSRRAFIRGGFGIMYDRVPGFVPFNERRTATWRTYTFTNPGTLDPEELRNRVIAGAGGTVRPSITLLPQRMDVPENRQWSLGLGAQLTPVLTLNIDYIRQDVRHLFASVNLNWLDVSQTPRRVLSSAYGNIIAWGDFARGRYRALLTNLSYHPDSTLRLNVAYTLASAKADWDVENTQAPAGAANQFYVMQRISGDERHRFVLSGTSVLPFGIRLSTVATVASPRPYRAQVGEDVNKNNMFEDDFIDGTRFRVPPNAWRNWYRVVDLRLTKGFEVRRGAQLSLIAEAFNVFNTENYSGYFGVQRSPTGEPRPDFGSPSGIFATRQLQLGSRLQF
ncbi:MAG TPA: carboxypeptidase regulatory-like domain-containing protein [Gemmatimonadaceae bacterium]|nr:carboxypeptidase regulatory-like domain-containing protein [Gemmatimonadaceae bacterium]